MKCQICHKEKDNLYISTIETPIRKTLKLKEMCCDCLIKTRISRGYKLIKGTWYHPSDSPNAWCKPGIYGFPY